MEEFEREWDKKFRQALEKVTPLQFTEIKKSVNDEKLKHNLNSSEISKTVAILNTLPQYLEDTEIQNIFTQCSCEYPVENLASLREFYQQSKDLSQTHQKLQEYFERTIQIYKQWRVQDFTFILENHWGLAGKMDGNSIIATKIPKDPTAYFSASSISEKKHAYCHCPRIRENFHTINPKSISPTYCYCGAGFYKKIWEYITDSAVEITLLKSITNGDDICQIQIDLNIKD